MGIVNETEETDKESYCMKGIVSTCGCHGDEKVCRYGIKATHATRCMHFVYKEFCDSLAAQLNNE